MWPLGDVDGWDLSGQAFTDPPVSRPLPVPDLARYLDPAEAGALSIPSPSEGHFIQGATFDARMSDRNAVEGRLSQTEVYGAALIDSLALFKPCALEFIVFDDDGVTHRWAVGTHPNHENPYLVDADLYAEQELDFLEGRATIGTVTVSIVDKAVPADDQDAGFVTVRLARLGVGDITGKRCQLIRYTTPTTPAVLIADGPAGVPTMDSSYAAYQIPIRDVRETERDLRLFDSIGITSPTISGTTPGLPEDGGGVDFGGITWGTLHNDP